MVGNGGNRNHVWVRLILLAVVVAGLTLLLYETGAIKFFLSKRRMISFLDSLGPWSFLGFVVLQAMQVVVAPIPGDVTGFLGGYAYGAVLGTILSTIGLTIGSYAAFALSRAFGRPFVEKFVDKRTLKRFDYLLHHKGAFLTFLLFLIPGFPKDYLCYILGLGDLTATEFLLIGSTGRLFGTIVLTLGGSYIRLHQYFRFCVLLGVALLIIMLALAYKDKIENLLKRLHARTEKAGEAGYSPYRGDV